MLLLQQTTPGLQKGSASPAPKALSVRGELNAANQLPIPREECLGEPESDDLEVLNLLPGLPPVTQKVLINWGIVP